MKNKFNDLADIYTNILNENIADAALGALKSGVNAVQGIAAAHPVATGAAAGLGAGLAASKMTDDDEENTTQSALTLDKNTAQKVFDALCRALGDETSEDAEGFIDKTKDVLKTGTYAGGGALAGSAIGDAIGGPIGRYAGGALGAGLGARAAR